MAAHRYAGAGVLDKHTNVGYPGAFSLGRPSSSFITAHILVVLLMQLYHAVISSVKTPRFLHPFLPYRTLSAPNLL